MFEPMIGMVTPTVAVVLLVIALIIFGPGKLPELGKSLGKGIKEFKSATEEAEPVKESKVVEVKEEVKEKE